MMYSHVYWNSIVNKQQQIVDEIITDLSSRKGLQEEWEQIDADIRSEIRFTWEYLVKCILNDSTER